MKKQKQKEIVFLDTETTGLDIDKDEIMELAIVLLKNKGKKSYLFNKLLKPNIECSEGAFYCHGITNKMVENEKHFMHYYNELKELLKDKTIIAYNTNYHIKIINNICKRYNKENLIDESNIFCLMEKHSDLLGYEYYYSLTTLYCSEFIETITPKCDFKNINHRYKRAISDCLMSKYLYKGTNWR